MYSVTPGGRITKLFMADHRALSAVNSELCHRRLFCVGLAPNHILRAISRELKGLAGSYLFACPNSPALSLPSPRWKNRTPEANLLSTVMKGHSDHMNSHSTLRPFAPLQAGWDAQETDPFLLQKNLKCCNPSLLKCILILF